jgi:hypothetical protein
MTGREVSKVKAKLKVSLGFSTAPRKHGELKYSSTIFNLGSRWSCLHLETTAALPLRRQLPDAVLQEIGWASEPV